jgi:hypothetical protein
MCLQVDIRPKCDHRKGILQALLELISSTLIAGGIYQRTAVRRGSQKGVLRKFSS